MKLLYGTGAGYFDITEQALSKLTHGSYIVIPAGDHARTNYFGDPAPGVAKEIKVLYKTRTEVNFPPNVTVSILVPPTGKEETVRQRYISLLAECLLDNIYGKQQALNVDSEVISTVGSDAVDNGTYWPDRAHTMIGRKRLDNLHYAVRTCLDEDVKGDIIETGVWRGGASIFARGLLEAYGVKDRLVYVADSFAGLPPNDPRYPHDTVDYTVMKPLAVSLEQVQDNFRRYDLLDKQVIFVKGFFENSLVQVTTPHLAVLRLDGDMYSSTIQVLEQLYDKVSPGGFIIVDDYGLPPCAQAITDFRKERGITSPIHLIDYFGAYWRK